MRVLVLTHAYEPVYTACAVRWAAISRELASSGVEVTVLTAWKPTLRREEHINGVRIVRVGGELTGGIRAVLRSRYQVGMRTLTEGPKGRSVARSVLAFLYYRIWSKVYWPDHACVWTVAAFRQLKTELKTGYDALISVSFPFTDHLVALMACGHLRDTQWIAESGDPFSFLEDTPPNNLAIYRSLNRRIETMVAERASAFVVPAAEIAELYTTSKVGKRANVHVIPHVISANSGRAVARRATTASLTLCYAGAFAKGVRTPDFMLAGLRALIRLMRDRVEMVEVDLYGSFNDCADSLGQIRDEIETGAIRVHGEVTPAVARGAIETADVLINVGNTTSYRQPSKVIEYMATGKPIVNFAGIRSDSSARMMWDYPATISIYQGEDTPETAAVRIFHFLTTVKPVCSSELNELRRMHSPASVAAGFVRLVQAATHGRSGE